MLERRTIVLALVHYYLPGFKAGGPIRSISNLVERLGDEFDLRIIAADRDFRDRKPYTDVVINDWNQVSNARVYYLRILLTMCSISIVFSTLYLHNCLCGLDG